jgi:hypothetical protein
MKVFARFFQKALLPFRAQAVLFCKKEPKNFHQ